MTASSIVRRMETARAGDRREALRECAREVGALRRSGDLSPSQLREWCVALAHWGQTSCGLPRTIAEATVAEGLSCGDLGPSPEIGIASAELRRKLSGTAKVLPTPRRPLTLGSTAMDHKGCGPFKAVLHPHQTESGRSRQAASARAAQEAARLVGSVR
jgi:hypothetical protein